MLVLRLASFLLAIALAACGGRDRPLDAGSDGGSVEDAAPSSDAELRDARADAPSPIDATLGDDAGGIDDAGSDAGRADAGPCTDHDDCSDGDECNGSELCFFGVCTSSGPPMCNDSDPCTADACDPTFGCTHVLVDADGDGHAPSSLGATCDDCDDMRVETYEGAPDEACNGVDDDCDGPVDEHGIVTSWADCDGDGFAATGAASMTICGVPSAPPASCTGAAAGWSEYDPGMYEDCRDDLAIVFPTAFGWRSMPIPGEPPASDFDYNCNGVEWKRWTTLGSCALDSTGSRCVLLEGWATAVPECGVSAGWIEICAMSPGPGVWECNPTIRMRPQECH